MGVEGCQEQQLVNSDEGYDERAVDCEGLTDSSSENQNTTEVGLKRSHTVGQMRPYSSFNHYVYKKSSYASTKVSICYAILLVIHCSLKLWKLLQCFELNYRKYALTTDCLLWSISLFYRSFTGRIFSRRCHNKWCRIITGNFFATLENVSERSTFYSGRQLEFFGIDCHSRIFVKAVSVCLGKNWYRKVDLNVFGLVDHHQNLKIYKLQKL